MNTIITNNIGLSQSYPMPEDIHYHLGTERPKERSCFYDFGAESSLEFTGYEEKTSSAFIESIVDMF